MGMWVGGRGKRLGAGEGISVAGGADTKWPTYMCTCVCACVFMGGVSSRCLIFLKWDFPTILRNSLQKAL